MRQWKRFLWATATLKRKLNKDFLSIYTTENHLLLCPKFYGLSWKSDETNSLQRKINNTNLEKEYLELIMTAYKSVINKDSTLYQVQLDRTASPSQNILLVDKEPYDSIQDKFNYFGEVLDQKPLKAFPQMVSIDPEYVITQSRLIIEKALKLYYLKSTGRVAKENLVELINQSERDNLISPRVVNFLHTVRKSGNYTIHYGSNKSWLQEEAAIIMQAIQIILGEIVEKSDY